MVSKSRFLISLWLMILVFFSLACNLLAGRMTPTPTPVASPVLPESSLQERAEQSRDQFESQGSFELTVTESELTDLAVRELSGRADSPLTEPRILLSEGQITILGNVEQAGFSVPAEIKLLPVISADGELQVEVLSMSIGPFAVPQQMVDQVSSLANDLVARQMSEAGNVRVKNITIQNGVLTVSGSRR